MLYYYKLVWTIWTSLSAVPRKAVKFNHSLTHYKLITQVMVTVSLRWRHNGRDSVSNHQPHHCLLNHLSRRRSKETSKLRVTGLCAGNSPGPVNSPHKWPVTRKMFPFDDVIMIMSVSITTYYYSTYKYAMLCQSWVGIGPMLAASGRFRSSSGTLCYIS